MGQKESKQNYLFTENYGYHMISLEKNPHHLIKSYQLTSEDEQESFKTLLQIYKTIEIPTIIPILQYRQSPSQMFAWNVHFGYYHSSLDQDILFHQKNSQHYPQVEILNFIDCILSGLMAFQFKHLYHGDLRPSRIVIDQIDGKRMYLIGLPLLLNNTTMQEELKNNSLKDFYISPQLYEIVSKNKVEVLNRERNDIFSLALIALQMASLTKGNSFYKENGLMDFQGIYEKIYCCRAHYSCEFCHMIEKMLEKQSKKRVDFTETYNLLEDLLILNEKKAEKMNNSQKGLDQVQENMFYVESPELREMMYISEENNEAWQNFINSPL